jgi:hypothetical protein
VHVGNKSTEGERVEQHEIELKVVKGRAMEWDILT